MIWNFLWVALGGALGSMARYGVALGMKQFGATGPIPWGTWTANVLGSFVIGLLAEWAGSKVGLSAEARLLWMTGFCGGFTTLSSLMLEVQSLGRGGQWGLSGLYLLLSLVVPFLAVWAGSSLAKSLIR